MRWGKSRFVCFSHLSFVLSQSFIYFDTAQRFYCVYVPLAVVDSLFPKSAWNVRVPCSMFICAHCTFVWATQTFIRTKKRKITQNYAIKCGFDSNTHYPVLYTDSTLSAFIYLTCGDGEIKCESNQMAREWFQLPCNFSYWTFDGVKFSSLVHFSWYIFFSPQFFFSL